MLISPFVLVEITFMPIIVVLLVGLACGPNGSSGLVCPASFRGRVVGECWMDDGDGESDDDVMWRVER